MAAKFDPLIRYPLARAEANPHLDGHGSLDGPLDATHLLIQVNGHAVGAVTLAATTNQDAIDPYGFEFDLDPSDARRLADQLLAASAQLAGTAHES
jgi:hypothetical protein